MSENILNLEKILEYKFKKSELLEEAITHSSLNYNKKNNYERLEFLGDKILGFIVSNYIFKKFPNSNEGELSSVFQKYTNEDFLSLVAFELKLNKYVKVQKGDSLEENTSIMADLIESLIAAIYLDSNLIEATNFVSRKILRSSVVVDLKKRHSKTLLQEFSLKEYKIIPTYCLQKKNGPDHEPTFFIKVKIGSEFEAIGKGNSIQKAEEAAANELLKKINTNMELNY